MKKFLLFLLIIFLGISTLFAYKLKTLPEKKSTVLPVKKIPSPTPIPIISKKSIFVPDWSLDGSELTGDYDRWIYFGNNSQLSVFSKSVKSGNKWLTLKLNEVGEQGDWENLANDTIANAKKYQMEGIVLDLEINALPFQDSITEINNLVEFFYKKTKESNLKMALALYGDLFYRKRPYDLISLNKNCDEIMIMAYDFHKSMGEPGPNFPFFGEKYNYNFQQMINDYLKYVPAEKLTVVFGMYGYDWQVDEKKRPINQAKALTLNEIKKKFLNKCEWKDCIIQRNNDAKETEINYVISRVVDNYGYIDYHVVWFEDEESVKIKSELLKEKKIGSTAFWAWGYF